MSDNINEITRELQQLRDEVRDMKAVGGGIALAKPTGHSNWSAHANWSSGSKKLAGDFSVSSKIDHPYNAAQLDILIRDSSSDKLIEVAKNLSQIVSE